MLLITGSIAFDTVETPFDRAERVLGGAAVYSACAASLFTNTAVVGVVGEDFSKEYIDILNTRNIDTSGIKKEQGKTFFWHGKYDIDTNKRETITVELNVFEKFSPLLSDEHKNAEYLFLANIDPDIQYKVLQQCSNLKFSACDTMDLWIETKKDSLLRVFSKIDAILLNDSEARQFTGEYNLKKAALKIFEVGPSVVIIKKGEHGALMFYKKEKKVFVVPAYLIDEVKDPTGAGDTFAGGFIGYLAKIGEITEKTLKQAMVIGNTVASFCVEDFGIGKLLQITKQDIISRGNFLREIIMFEVLNEM